MSVRTERVILYNIESRTVWISKRVEKIRVTTDCADCGAMHNAESAGYYNYNTAVYHKPVMRF